MVSTQQAKNIIDANILDTFTLFIEILVVCTYIYFGSKPFRFENPEGGVVI